MNERIRELALQAMTYVTHNPKANKLNSGDMFDEKFAELIIRECAGLLQKEAESSHDEGSPSYNVLLQESNWMKRHFGVEE